MLTVASIIVEKSDGGFNYATTDLATVVSRQKKNFSPGKNYLCY